MLALVSCSREPANRHSDTLLQAQVDALQGQRYRDMLLHDEADALYAKTVLTELRDGHPTNALELLELQIDTSVNMIDHSLPKLSGWERDNALSTLRLLKTYREKHPRQQEAVIPDAEKQDTETLNQARENASRILSDLK